VLISRGAEALSSALRDRLSRHFNHAAALLQRTDAAEAAALYFSFSTWSRHVVPYPSAVLKPAASCPSCLFP
jgi:hypothetical protein